MTEMTMICHRMENSGSRNCETKRIIFSWTPSTVNRTQGQHRYILSCCIYSKSNNPLLLDITESGSDFQIKYSTNIRSAIVFHANNLKEWKSHELITYYGRHNGNIVRT